MATARLTAREAALRVIARLHQQGCVAYLAGGCVRDTLLGVEPKDYDVATDAPPGVTLGLFPGSRAVGESFGVVLVGIGGHSVEVATFREEWGYADGRRPDGVRFTDAEHDARRRDFTINGMFAEPLPDGPDVVIDHVGGRADLDAKLIRAIGEPDDRFGEDYLRMLRAVRFAARLGFDIEPRTGASIRSHARYLGQISRERIGMEVLVMLAHPTRAAAAALMQSLKLDGPALNEDHTDPALPTLESLDEGASATTALAAWMIDRESTATLDRWRNALNLSNDDRNAAAGALRLRERAAHWPDLAVAQRKRLLAERDWTAALTLLRAENRAATIEHEAAPLLAEGVAPEPWVTGEDLIGMGLEPGPDFGRWLDDVYDAQLDGRVTDRDTALAWVRSHTGE